MKKFMNMRPHGDKGLNDLIELLPNNIIGVEIGSYRGQSAEIFLKSGKFDKLYCIDPWMINYDNNDSASKSDMGKVEKDFDDRVGKYNNVIKIKGTIDTAIDDLPEFDFVYIDGKHTYDSVKNDITKSLLKLKKGGYLSGHDWCDAWPNVVKAIKEMIGEPDEVFSDGSWIKVIY